MTLPGQGWRDSAACRGAGVDFFPHAGENNSRVRAVVRAAVATCRDCPVRLECLGWAIENKEFYGIWGGTTERERRAMIQIGVTAAEVCSIVVPT